MIELGLMTTEASSARAGATIRPTVLLSADNPTTAPRAFAPVRWEVRPGRRRPAAQDLRGARELARAGDVAVQLLDERLDRVEPQLVAQPVRELEPDRRAVDVAVEVEQVGLDADRVAAVGEGRVVSDADGGGVV